MLYITSAFVAIFLCATLTNVGAQGPDCPEGSDDFLFYPDTEDCSKYYRCYQGKKTSMQCPADMLWNTEGGFCDMPSNVDCNRNTDPTATPTTTPTKPTTPTTTQKTTTGNPNVTTSTPATGYTPDPLCPYPSETLIFYPYPDDCNKYYECFEGRLFTMNCPPKLWWNSARQSCDWPENVYCSVSSTTSRTTETEPATTPVITTVTTEETTTEAPTTTTPADTTAPTDETSPIETTTSSETTTPSVTTTPSDTTAPTEVTSATPTTTPGWLCKDLPDGTYLEYPGDCTKYIECNLGEDIVGQCPEHLYWHELITSCDFKDHVKCKE